MNQLSLLDPVQAWDYVDLPDAHIKFMPDFIDHSEQETLLAKLLSEIPWRQDYISMFGKRHPLPRLQQWFGDEGLSYKWSGILMKPLPWTPMLISLRRRVEAAVDGVSFNSVLLNRYRSGNDTVAWHADNERDLGPEPVIASVSLGARRDFLLRHALRGDVPQFSISLSSGSLLLMTGRTQQCWEHSIPRRKGVNSERVNLTFRQIRDNRS